MDLPNLRTLTFGSNFNQSLRLSENQRLQSLTLGENFNQSWKDVHLPSTLQHLTFGYRFDQPLDELPKELKSLRFGSLFNQSLEKVKLPEGLEHLTFGFTFNQSSLDFSLSTAFRFEILFETGETSIESNEAFEKFCRLAKLLRLRKNPFA